MFEYAAELGEPSDAELLRRLQDYRFDFAEGAPGVELESSLGPVEGDLVFSALKAAEDGDGVVLRVLDAGEPFRGPAEGPRLRSWRVRCRLDETPLAETGTQVRPGEIASFRL